MAFSNPIIKGLRADFLSGMYSDMRVIASDGTSYRVHKVVLCYHSQFFANAMKEGRFKEGYENTIHLEDKDSSMVYAMLHYLYCQMHTYPSGLTTEDKIIFDIKIWAMADEYMISSLAKHVLRSLKTRMTTSSYRDIAWRKSTLPRIIQAAYDKTADTGKELRSIFVRMAAESALELLNDEGFRQSMRDMPDFAMDLMEKLAMGNKELSLTVKTLKRSSSPMYTDEDSDH